MLEREYNAAIVDSRECTDDSDTFDSSNVKGLFINPSQQKKPIIDNMRQSCLTLLLDFASLSLLLGHSAYKALSNTYVDSLAHC
jgi:hypothetical protein